MEGLVPEPLAIHNMAAGEEQAAVEGLVELTIMVRNMVRRGALTQEAVEALPMIADPEVSVSTEAQETCPSALEPAVAEVMVVEGAVRQAMRAMVAAMADLMVVLVHLP